jgi:hypothetical protein
VELRLRQFWAGMPNHCNKKLPLIKIGGVKLFDLRASTLRPDSAAAITATERRGYS